MNALPEIPFIREQAARVSKEEYHQLTEGRPTELIRGTILDKMSKSPRHTLLSQRIRKILERQISPEHTLFTEQPLSFADSEPEPDVYVVFGQDSDYETEHPATAELVVEIAVTSLPLDRLKARIFDEAEVKEYWIVQPDVKTVEVYRHPKDQSYTERTEMTAPGILECAALTGVRVDLAALFA